MTENESLIQALRYCASNESLIQALRYCASGAKFPKDCDGCPLYCAGGKMCVECIDNILTQAADALEKQEGMTYDD